MKRSFASGSRAMAAVLAVAMTLGSLAGCGGSMLSIQQVPPDAAAKRSVRVALLELEDGRAIVSQDPDFPAIPLVVWWVSFEYGQWDKAKRSVRGTFMKRYQDRLAAELKATGAFDEVVVVASASEAGKYPIIIKGKVLESMQRGKVMYYGLSFLAKYLHMIGVPAKSHYWTLKVEYEAIDSLTGKTLVAKRTFENTSDGRSYSKYADEDDVPELIEAETNIAQSVASYMRSSLPKANSPELTTLVAAFNKKQSELAEARKLSTTVAPPTLAISAPREGQQLRMAETTLDFNLGAQGGIKGASASVNGETVPMPDLDKMLTTDRDSAPRSFAASLPITLDLGDNTIAVSVTDMLDKSADRSLKVQRLPRVLFTNKRKALVVGVSQYGDSELANAQSSGSAAARAFSAYLVDPFGGQMAPSDVTMLLDAQATRESVSLALNKIVREATAGDTIIVAIAALSAQPDSSAPGFVLLSDGQAANVAGTGLPTLDLLNALGESLAKETILIADLSQPAPGSELNASGSILDGVRRLRNPVAALTSADAGDAVSRAGSPAFLRVFLDSLDATADLNRDGRIVLEEAVEAATAKAGDAGLPAPRLSARGVQDVGLKMLE